MSSHIRLATCAFLLCIGCPSFSLPLQSRPPSPFPPPPISIKNVALAKEKEGAKTILSPAEQFKAPTKIIEEHGGNGATSEQVGVLEAGRKLVAAADSALKALVLPPKTIDVTTAPTGDEAGNVDTRGKAEVEGDTRIKHENGGSAVERGALESKVENAGEGGVITDGKKMETEKEVVEKGGAPLKVEGASSGKTKGDEEKEDDEDAAAGIDYFDDADSQEALHEPVIHEIVKGKDEVYVKGEKMETGDVGVESLKERVVEREKIVEKTGEVKEEEVVNAHPEPAAVAETRPTEGEEGKEKVGNVVNMREDGTSKNEEGEQENTHKEESFEGLMHEAEHGSPDWEREKVLMEKAEVPQQQEQRIPRPKLKTQVLTDEYLMDAAHSEPAGHVSWTLVGVAMTVVMFFVTIRTRRMGRRASLVGKHRGSFY